MQKYVGNDKKKKKRWVRGMFDVKIFVIKDVDMRFFPMSLV